MIITDVGHRIKSQLNIIGMSARQLSKQTGISQASISRILNGKQFPTLRTFEKIVSILDSKPLRISVNGAGVKIESISKAFLFEMIKDFDKNPIKAMNTIYRLGYIKGFKANKGDS